MLRDAERREKPRIERENFRRRVAAIKFTEQAGDGLDDERIGVAIEETFAGAALRNKPEFGQAAGNQVVVHAQFRRGRRAFLRLLNEERKAVLTVLQGGQLRGELKLFFREVHGAENGLIAVALRFFGFLRRTRFFGPRA